MQTFLPYPDFRLSAQALDRQRLGKQRLECKQLLQATPKSPWYNHPANVMWRSRRRGLALYGLEICLEWKRRGYADSLTDFFESLAYGSELKGRPVYPWWFGNHEFHAAHRSNLLRKDPEHYGPQLWIEPPDLPYLWPAQSAGGGFRTIVKE